MYLKEGFCFLNREEANSWNRVKRCPGSRWADKKDESRVDFILNECEKHGVTRLRSEDGVKLWESEN